MLKISRKYAMKQAKDHYEHESGLRKAVDEGIINMEEFAIYHCVSAYMNLNMPIGLIDGGPDDNREEHDRIFNSMLPDAYKTASRLFGIGPEKAESLFKKILRIPSVAP